MHIALISVILSKKVKKVTISGTIEYLKCKVKKKKNSTRMTTNLEQMDLPTAWNVNDKFDHLSVNSDGLRVDYIIEDTGNVV